MSDDSRCIATGPRSRSAPSALKLSKRRSSEMIAVPMCPRSFVSTLMPTAQPPCNGPSSRSAGSWTSVKNTSSNSDPPVICRSGLISMPDRSIGHRKNEMPSCFRSEEHTSELQSRQYLVCRLLLEKKKKKQHTYIYIKKKKKKNYKTII